MEIAITLENGKVNYQLTESEFTRLTWSSMVSFEPGQ